MSPGTWRALALCLLLMPTACATTRTVSDSCGVWKPFPKRLATTPELKRWGAANNLARREICPPPEG